MISLFRKGKTTRASFIINTLGMGVAIAAFYILAVQVNFMFGYNKKLPDHENIYAMHVPQFNGEGRMTSICRPLAERLISELPEIAAGGEFGPWGQSWRSYSLQPEGEHGSAENGFPRNLNTQFTYVTKPTVEILGYEFIQGSWAAMEGDDRHLAVSESLAKKFDLQVGDIIQENADDGKKMCEVVAIFKDAPKNSDLERFDVLCDICNESIDSWSEGSFTYIVKPAAGLTPDDLDRAADARLRRAWTEGGFFPEGYGTAENDEELEEAMGEVNVKFIPIADLYFSEIGSNYMRQGNKGMAYGWIAIALLILFVAIINYVNMFFALVPVKMRGINTRKILGSSRASLTMSVVLEAVTMTAVSVGLAVVLLLIMQSTTYAGLLACSVSIARNAGVALLCAVGAIVVAVGSSLYPALYITSFEPAFALKANFGASQTDRTLRYALVMVQFTVAIAFIIMTILVDIQNRFLLKHDMGFNRENIVVAHVSNKVGNESETVASALQRNPQVKDVAWGDGRLVWWGRMSWGQTIDGNNCMWELYPCSWNMLDFLGIEIVEGRNFTKTDAQTETGVMIFNETARNQYGFTPGKMIPGHAKKDAEIVGICKDFNAWPMSQAVRPYCFYVWGDNGYRPCTELFVRTTASADIREVFKHIEQTVMSFDEKLTTEDINVHLFDNDLQQLYDDVKRFAKVTRMLSIITIIIALLGVFGLVLFETEYRRKEIGIRRVNGATIADVLRMFNRRYVLIVLACFGIAAPVSYVVISAYLQQFAYRTAIHWWVFVLSLVAVMAITVTIVTLRSLRAATSDPVESLRTE
ncbi:MAG: ABC transporter permease [Salinivirgaceae bacterium]|nr:ABC transporter permease [Salinivirgaceae bacterium]